MDEETKLNIENMSLKLDDEIKYITSIENKYMYILTETNFYIYSKTKDKESLLSYQIPENPDINQDSQINDEFIKRK